MTRSRKDEVKSKKWFKSTYLSVIKHGHGESPVNGGSNRKTIHKWSIFQCHLKLPEGKSSDIHVQLQTLPQAAVVLVLFHDVSFEDSKIMHDKNCVKKTRRKPFSWFKLNPRSLEMFRLYNYTTYILS